MIKTLKQKCVPASMSMLVLFMCTVMIVMPVMTGCAKVQQTLATVLAKAPTVIAIVNTAIDLYNIVDPEGGDLNLKAQVAGYANEAVKDIGLLQQVIASYQADIGSAPPSALAQADALVGTITAQLNGLTAVFHVKSAKSQAEAAAIVDAANIFLSELASLLPPPQLVNAPASAAVLKAQAATVGNASGSSPPKVKIVSAHDFANNFNKKSKTNFPQIQVVVPK